MKTNNSLQLPMSVKYLVAIVKGQLLRVTREPLRGFTLIELIVVIGIIGVLSTVGMANYLNAQVRGRDALRKSDLKQLQSAMELYRVDQGQYPASLPVCNVALTGGTSTYIAKVPCDPKTRSSYTYSATTTTYRLITCLENTRDSSKDTTNTAPCNGTSNWSYSVTNP